MNSKRRFRSSLRRQTAGRSSLDCEELLLVGSRIPFSIATSLRVFLSWRSRTQGGGRATGRAGDGMPNKPPLPPAPTSLIPTSLAPSPSRPRPARPATTSLSALPSRPRPARPATTSLSALPSRPRPARPATTSLSALPSRPRPARPATASLFAALSAAARASRHCVALRCSLGRCPRVPSLRRSSKFSRPRPVRSSFISRCASRLAACRAFRPRVFSESAVRVGRHGDSRTGAVRLEGQTHGCGSFAVVSRATCCEAAVVALIPQPLLPPVIRQEKGSTQHSHRALLATLPSRASCDAPIPRVSAPPSPAGSPAGEGVGG